MQGFLGQRVRHQSQNNNFKASKAVSDMVANNVTNVICAALDRIYFCREWTEQ